MCQLRFDADCFFGCLQRFLTDCVMKEAPETPEVAGAIVILLLAFSWQLPTCWVGSHPKMTLSPACQVDLSYGGGKGLPVNKVMAQNMILCVFSHF